LIHVVGEEFVVVSYIDLFHFDVVNDSHEVADFDLAGSRCCL
jgi:tRNA splicing ligase